MNSVYLIESQNISIITKDKENFDTDYNKNI